MLPTLFSLSRTPAENCARSKGLGYTVSKHIKMYGERFELVSDPFQGRLIAGWFK
jgi:hypothetical protein